MSNKELTKHALNALAVFNDKEKECPCCTKKFIVSYTLQAYVYKILISNHIWVYCCGYTCWQRYKTKFEEDSAARNKVMKQKQADKRKGAKYAKHK